MLVHLADGVFKVSVECDFCNDAVEELAPVLPNQLSCSEIRILVTNLEKYDKRLKNCCFSEAAIQQINQEFCSLVTSLSYGGLAYEGH